MLLGCLGVLLFVNLVIQTAGGVSSAEHPEGRAGPSNLLRTPKRSVTN